MGRLPAESQWLRARDGRASKPEPPRRRPFIGGQGCERPAVVASIMIGPPPVSRFYYFEILGTTVFAISGVLAVTRRGLDVFGALVLGVVTALGGGTVRDVII